MPQNYSDKNYINHTDFYCVAKYLIIRKIREEYLYMNHRPSKTMRQRYSDINHRPSKSMRQK